MTLEEMIAVAKLDDPLERLMLADALEEAGRLADARALRPEGPLTLRQMKAVVRGVMRCKLEQWLVDGLAIYRDGCSVSKVEVTDRRPHFERGNPRTYCWYRSDDPENAILKRPARSLLPPEIYPYAVGLSPKGRATSEIDRAMLDLSCGLINWARGNADK